MPFILENALSVADAERGVRLQAMRVPLANQIIGALCLEYKGKVIPFEGWRGDDPANWRKVIWTVKALGEAIQSVGLPKAPKMDLTEWQEVRILIEEGLREWEIQSGYGRVHEVETRFD